MQWREKIREREWWIMDAKNTFVDKAENDIHHDVWKRITRQTLSKAGIDEERWKRMYIDKYSAVYVLRWIL